MRFHESFVPQYRCSLAALVLGIVATAPGLPGLSSAAAEPPDDHARALTRSVGRLHVPAIRYEEGRARHFDEQCSATLVSLGEQPRSKLLLSAWHCLEDYVDLSRPITFEVPKGERVEVRPLASGGSMHSDWVLLRLPRDLPDPLPLAEAVEDLTAPVRLAGYPRDAETLRMQDCRNTGRDGRDQRTGCVARRGASGGAVVSLPANGGPRFIGVISRGDGVSQSIYVPVERILPRIRSFFEPRAATLPWRGCEERRRCNDQVTRKFDVHGPRVLAIEDREGARRSFARRQSRLRAIPCFPDVAAGPRCASPRFRARSIWRWRSAKRRRRSSL